MPAAWAGRHVQLELERVIWESRAWVDGKPAGTADALDTPHFHDLGVLTPGRHTVTLRVDNRMIHPVGTDGHNFTEQTQTIWNGVVGKIELRATPDARLVRVRGVPRRRRQTGAGGGDGREHRGGRGRAARLEPDRRRDTRHRRHGHLDPST